MIDRYLRNKFFEKFALAKIIEIENALSCPVAKKVCHMMATSHEYKTPNIDGALAMTKNYEWELTKERVSNLQGLDKPIDKAKVLRIAEGIAGKEAAPLIVVNSLHGIRPQSRGKKILLDGHHRLAALEHNGTLETPVYRGTYTGGSQLSKAELRASDVSDKVAWLRLRTLEKLSATEVKPYTHQTKAINKLIRNNGSIIMAHPVGSGKTLTSVMGMEAMREKGIADKALVLTPASLRENYAKNGIALATDLPYAILGNKAEVASGDKQGLESLTGKEKYVVMSYDMFKKDPEKYIAHTGADTIICDEMHRAKDESTSVYDSLRSSRHLYKNFIGMTGSIISNQPGEIFPLMDIVNGGIHKLGNNMQDFYKKFFKKTYTNGSRRGEITGLKNVGVLKSELSRSIHYVDADELDKSNMPKKVITDINVSMSPTQLTLYNKAMDQVPLVLRQKMARGETMTDGELSKYYNTAIVARRISNGVHTATNGITLEQSALATPKIVAILNDVQEHLKDTPDGQVIITSNLVNGGVDVVEAGLKVRGLDYGIFIGKGNKGITEVSRQQDVDEYNAGKKRIILISGAGGEGISLGNTTMIACLDGHYNPEKINQMEARGIRSGGQALRPQSKRRVEVRRYQSTFPPVTGLRALLPKFMRNTPTTVDQQIYGIAKRKAATNEILLAALRQTSKGSGSKVKSSEHVAALRGRTMEKLAGIKDVLYHGSGTHGLTHLEPKVCNHDSSWVYATPEKVFSTVFAGQIRPNTVSLGTIDGMKYIGEIRPGAFKKSFNKPASVYTVASDGFTQNEKTTRLERVSPHRTPVLSEEHIPNIWNKLEEHERNGELYIKRHIEGQESARPSVEELKEYYGKRPAK